MIYRVGSIMGEIDDWSVKDLMELKDEIQKRLDKILEDDEVGVCEKSGGETATKIAGLGKNNK